MADTHESPVSTATHEEHHARPNYIAVFVVLVVLTAVSFWTVSDFWPLTPRAGHLVVMVVAVSKAVLVAMFFMHLKFDWFKVYVMIVPALILGTIAVCALLPDMVFGDTSLARGLPFLQE